MTEIDSDGLVADIERCAKVVAGPGAGKTHWLTGHIKRVARESARLRGGGKVACISYTNVAVEEIRSRLGDAAHSVETDTIHGFLYKYVVRPYARLLRSDDGKPLLNHAAIDGHDEHKPSPGILKEWIRLSSTLNYVPKGAEGYLRKLRWVRDDGGQWSLKPINYTELPSGLPTRSLASYKPLFWQRGIIDHDDVLYLAYRILEENPGLSAFLAARFPYVFVDEFQDTSPVQAAVVRWLAAAGSVVVVIGDREQSIYGFQGAKPDDFESFSVPNLDRYVIAGNRRSTRSIVDFLNSVRRDGLVQISLKEEEGSPVTVYVGRIEDHLREARKAAPEGCEVVCLLRRNDGVRAVLHPAGLSLKNPWDELEAADWDRTFFLEKVFHGVSLHSQGELAKAVLEASKGFRLRGGSFRAPLKGSVNDLIRKGATVLALEYLCENDGEILSDTLSHIYAGLTSHLWTKMGIDSVALRDGKFSKAASKMTGSELIKRIRVKEVQNWARTIHQAKGAEFDHVLVGMDDKATERFFLKYGSSNEEMRLCYVAASRAKERLCFSVPELSSAAYGALAIIGAEVVNI